MTIALEAETRRIARRQRIGHALTRLATISDQLLIALANFALTISIGRSFKAEEVAAYGIGLSAGLMIQALQRHAILIPLMLQHPAKATRRESGIFATHGLVLVCVVLFGVGGLAMAALIDLSRFSFLIVAASAVCLLVYVELEFARAILVKINRPSLLFVSAGWYALIAAVLAWASLQHRMGFEGVLAAIAAAMLIHAAALFTLPRSISLTQGLRLLSADIRAYGAWAVVATLTYSGYNHLPLFVLGAMAPPIHSAAFVATRSLMQPLQILLRGLDVADKAMLAKQAAGQRSAFALTIKLASVYALAASFFGGVACLFSDELVHLAYGEKFAGFGPALLAWVPAYVLVSVSMPFESLVYKRQVFRSYYLVRGISSVVAVLLTIPLMPWAEVGAISACSVGSLIAVLGTVFILTREPRQ
jgi:O-antigen/teichoic acid export membrane protein